MPRRPERLRTFEYLGLHRYFLTFCTYDRRPYFLEGEKVAFVWDHFLRAAREQHCAVIVYCFMPDHAHLVVEGLQLDADLRCFIKTAKQYSGFYFQQQQGQRLWQRYGYERVLREDETTQEVVR